MDSENEAFLKTCHAKHPGGTPRAMANGRTLDGRSSYDLLAAVVPTDTTANATVLDLACGDGFLLQMLHERNPDGPQLIGVDMSEHELSAARQRIKNDRVSLHVAKAQAIPLPDASADYVLCHMAIMLMDSVEHVIEEIRRILKPGGTFSAIVGAKVDKRPPSYAAFMQALTEALSAEGRTFLSGLGDARIRTDEGMRVLFTETTGFAQPLLIADHILRLDQSVDAVTEYFMAAYDTDLLSPEGFDSLEKKLRKSLEVLADRHNIVACAAGLKHLTCTRVMH